MYVCNTHAKDLQELLEAREQECVWLRRQLKERKSTASLRQNLIHSENSRSVSAVTLRDLSSHRLLACLTSASLLSDQCVDNALSLPPVRPPVVETALRLHHRAALASRL